MKYKVWHDRPSCIACGACAAISENWFMNDADGLADHKRDVIDENEYAANKEAADVCPVSIIHIEEASKE